MMFGKLKFIGEILIVTVCAYYLGLAGYMAVKPVDIALPDIAAGNEGARVQEKVDQSYYNIINDRNLFAAFDPAKVVKKPKRKRKPKPKKDLSKLPVASSVFRLSGTVYASDPKLRRCIVTVDGKVSVLKPGQRVKNFTVAEIKRRAVILSRGGNRKS